MHFRDRSKDYLANTLKDCFHDMYVSVLDRTEKLLKPNQNSQEWKHYRFNILNLGNDYIRKVDTILKEYEVEFRPLIFRVEYKDRENNIIPESKLIEIDFGFIKDEPFFSILSRNLTLNDEFLDIAESLGCGQIGKIKDQKGEILALTVTGMYNIFHKLIPFMINNNAIKGAALERFNIWKEKVYQLEGQGYVKKNS